MKSKIISLSKNNDFKSVLGGKKIYNKYLTIFFKKLPDKDYKKLNVSFITKKKLGNAVKRNKIKRRLRNIMNDAEKKLNLNLKYCYLLIANILVLNESYENIKQTLFNDFKKIK
ncbi:MAG: ribonuclease P protein component [Candidatus Pelagibacter sp.]|tara:strand:+ start:165 stop:506 length:342 start_codon:yes stop_codon:yes gene_type:complete